MTFDGSEESVAQALSSDRHHPDAPLTTESFRELSVEDMIRWIGQNGEPEDARRDVDTESLQKRFPHLARVQIEPISIDGSVGALHGRAYVDHSRDLTGRGLIWAHGGAFLGGSLDMPEANWVAMEVASRGVPVLSIDYAKCVNGVHYPAPSDDVLLWWAAAQEHSSAWLGVDSGSLVLGGASAGAALAASLVRRSIDTSSAVPAGLILVYPALHPDPSDPSARGPFDPQTHGLSLNYAGSQHALLDPHVFAGLGDGNGYPPTLVVGCELDELLPSAEAFFEMLQASGVEARLRVEPNSHHGHLNEPADPQARSTINALFKWVRDVARQ